MPVGALTMGLLSSRAICLIVTRNQLPWVVYKTSWPIGRVFAFFLLSWALFCCCWHVDECLPDFLQVYDSWVLLAMDVWSCLSVALSFVEGAHMMWTFHLMNLLGLEIVQAWSSVLKTLYQWRCTSTWRWRVSYFWWNFKGILFEDK